MFFVHVYSVLQGLTMAILGDQLAQNWIRSQAANHDKVPASVSLGLRHEQTA